MMRNIILGAAACAMLTGAAFAQGSPSKPAGQGTTSSTPASNVPPPAKAKDSALDQARQGVEYSLLAKTAGVNGAALAAQGLNPPTVVTKDLIRVNRFIDGAGKALDVVDAYKTYDTARGQLESGNRRGAAVTVIGAGIEKCADLAIQIGCTIAVAPAAPTVIGAVAGRPLCVAALTAAKEVCDDQFKKAHNGQGMAEVTAGRIVDFGGKVKDFVSERYDSWATDFDLSRMNADNRYDQAHSANEQAAQQQAQQLVATQNAAPSGFDGMALVDSLMTGLASATTEPTNGPSVAPAAIAPAPAPAVTNNGACHANHNEISHPGGCHEPPLGAR